MKYACNQRRWCTYFVKNRPENVKIIKYENFFNTRASITRKNFPQKKEEKWLSVNENSDDLRMCV